MIRRILWLLLCAVRHPSAIAEYRGGIRCFRCNPLRKWPKPIGLQLSIPEIDQLAEGYRNPPEA